MLARQVLSADALFVLMSGYAAGYSPTAYENCLRAAMDGMPGTIASGELALEESGSADSLQTDTKRLLPAGIYARWSK